MANLQYVTKEGLDKLREELKYLESVERPRISQQIAEARDKGDLSENAEYDAAKEAQGLLEAKISKLQDQVANARVIDKSQLDSTKVSILSTVKIKNLANGQEMKYTLVPETEADLKAGKIAVSTPIAKGLLGKELGEKAEIKLPNGNVLNFEITELSLGEE
ncbi:transcription elongation factor GreA [Ornithobacterium rhinotracheale]|uniref:Transcription elongation factor GreA n=1 Tax=Ornithobacterium rhinotracheale (strain ATCC 51463 / DSM 15997 / CCUG 23171 / CIP 104009 / LMG 9086) TaxID=867902 RepID=I4A1K3_ORNRL|nr:transcription elongation factor GreA [Ornithobacterium rhinotracheale]AFL97837.1 transcription elongation factor GreA [Ornithobacterium rhinotracheale DSM 15997]AIP99662.1 transcription elongation factor GreA [Ornithobacterium rhinotracheale ORT-UMN 88]KGB65901.1 transcription elongation factor GreA [Ornithobacterium rhinotracheale H06-030791]MBN3661519.1 transcription elongation factor GreA [Ornithobacterium rhinotracheale]MCK0193866.1 transcription elongation factor GreA [Ornithobacterium